MTELPDDAGRRRRGRVGHRDRVGLRAPGHDVTLYEGLDRVLPTEDADISKIAERGFKKQGIKVRTGVFVENVVVGRGRRDVHRRRRAREAEWLVIAAGRAPDVEGLGLEEAGIALTDGGPRRRRRRDAHLAARRLRDRRPRARPGARAQGLRRGHHRRRGRGGPADAPDRVHRHPARDVLLPERRQLRPHRAAGARRRPRRRRRQLRFGAVGAGTVYGDRTGLVKIVGDQTYGELLGGHIVGTRATELIQELVNVRALEGGYGEIARIVHGHPTLSEAVMEAARDADGWIIHG